MVTSLTALRTRLALTYHVRAKRRGNALVAPIPLEKIATIDARDYHVQSLTSDSTLWSLDNSDFATPILPKGKERFVTSLKSLPDIKFSVELLDEPCYPPSSFSAPYGLYSVYTLHIPSFYDIPKLLSKQTYVLLEDSVLVYVLQKRMRANPEPIQPLRLLLTTLAQAGITEEQKIVWEGMTGTKLDEIVEESKQGKDAAEIFAITTPTEAEYDF